MTGPEPSTSRRAWTRLGAVSSSRRPVVDACGGVTPDLDGGGWSLDWWIGADDRWHLPQNEPSVRQHLVGETPVVETAMRIPGGDAVHRAYVVHGDPDELVVEVENRSPVPVALVLAVQPRNPLGRAPVGTVELADTELVVDGAVGVVLPKAPAHFEETRGAETIAAAAMFPLAHTAVLRVALPLDVVEPTVATTSVASLPSAERVAKGWEAQLRRGMRVVLPDDALGATVEANRAFLLLAHAGDHLVGAPDPEGYVSILRALDRWGFGREVGQVLVARAHEAADGPMLVALAEHWRLTGHRGLVDELSSSVAAGVRRLARVGRRRDEGADAWRVPGLRAAAGLLDSTGQARAAESVRREAVAVTRRLGRLALAEAEPARDDRSSPRQVAASARRGVEAADTGALEQLAWLLAVAGSRRTWPASVGGRSGHVDGHDIAAGAGFLDLVRTLLVHERGVASSDDEAGEPTLAMCTLWPPEWRGQGLEVHDAPTAHGRLSYAVRWHGERPALLWELEPRDPGSAPVTLVAPGLDTAWSSREPRGDALLAAPPERAGGAAPDQGASFS